MDLSSIMALGAAVFILLIGFRVYLLDRSNYQYRAFGFLCLLLSWMCFCWYELERTQDLDTAITWRRLQGVWTLTNPLIVYCCWRFASMYLRPAGKLAKQLFLLLILFPSLLFFGLELFSEHTHGTLVLLENGRWGLALDGLGILDVARGIWTFLVYGTAIYFIFLVWREEKIPFRKAWLFFLIVLLFAGASMTILQNYILSPAGVVLPINESWNTLVSVVFFGWALSDFQVFDLKPESAFEHVADSMTNLMIITNVKFRIKKISASGLDFFGTDAITARNADLKDIIGEEAAGKLINNLGVGQKQEITFFLGDRKVSILFSTSFICNRRGSLLGYVFVGDDLTDYYQALDKVRHYNMQLEDSNEALKRFAFAVSHDLKEPLRTVSGFVGLLDKQLKVNKPAIQEYIFHINQGISRMNALIDSILTASTLDHDDEEDQLVNTERILLEVKDRLGALCQEKNGAIIYEEDLPSIYGKYHQLSLLFQNIIENGLKYNEQEPAVVEISGKMETRGYTFSIRDNGIGIAPQDREKVFNMFKRLHSREDYSGTGIGLSMCKKIVEHLDGKIWITAPADGGPGTVFHIYIPREKIAIPGQVLSSSKTD